MRKLRLFFCIVSLCLTTVGSYAQYVDITPMIGYVMRSDLRFIQGNLEVQDKFNIGANFSFPTYNENGRIEFLLSNSFANARWIASPDYDTLVSNTNFSMMVSYFQISWIGAGEIDDDFFIFGGPAVGVMNYRAAANTGIENVLRFSVGVQAGLTYFFDNGLGFRLQCHMLLPVFLGSGEHFDGITDYGGEKGYVTVNSTTFPANFILNAGLIFRIKTGRWI